ncbi:luciferase family protein [Sulfitobacter sp. S190]|uniref:luciferase domain-containing protein n=1 Tax=Sulfitobacter sp. S190 TaxID=2867022 RepID=UPI0021A83D37|nr:luciferase family protein [Sulfitobacter sp. S190]UWR24524.1 DUF5519 family protein [Sulfitobacter sp. S190]
MEYEAADLLHTGHIVTRIGLVMVNRDRLKTLRLLPARIGPRPRTAPEPTHRQINQRPMLFFNDLILNTVSKYRHVLLGPVRRAPNGTVGFFLASSVGMTNPDMVLANDEFSHLHPRPDGSLHLALPVEARRIVMEKRWGEPHPDTGLNPSGDREMLLYCPRNRAELAVVLALLRLAYDTARVP